MILLSLLVIPFKSNADATSISKLSHAVETLIEVSPPLLLSKVEKEALRKYAGLLDGKNYTSGAQYANKGVENYFDRMWDENLNARATRWDSQGNPIFRTAELSSDAFSKKTRCFRSKAIDFYQDVATKLKHSNSVNSACEAGPVQKAIGIDYGCEATRPGLASSTTDNPALENGWVWKLALKHSKGNSFAAMQLIGMCGHDDYHQTEFMYEDNSEKANISLKESVASLKLKLKTELVDLTKQRDGDKKSVNDPEELQKILKVRDKYLDAIIKLETNGPQRMLNCPSAGSPFFTPRSLDASADITQELKKKIEAVQNPDRSKKINAKYYHVYGAAFSSCFLIANGFAPEKAIIVQKQVARLYRAEGICEYSKNLAEKSALLEQKIEKAAAQKKMTLNEFIYTEIKKTDHDKGCSRSADPQICKTVRDIFGHETTLFKKDPAAAKDRLDEKLKKIDAARLYNSWYVGGNTFGAHLLCTDIRIGGPKDLLDVNHSVSFIGARPAGWTPERYDAAAKQLATWDVDFEWTIAQHEAGALFAAKNCKKENQAEGVFENICSPSAISSPPAPQTAVPGKSRVSK